MSLQELNVVSSLLGEPVRCWELMKFDYTLMSLSWLLFSCGRSSEAWNLIQLFQSLCPGNLNRRVNLVKVLLRFVKLSTRQSWNNEPEKTLDQLANTFSHLGSPSWAMKNQ